jgi:hypothetical protein
MAQTKMDWPVSFALFSTSDRVKRSEGYLSCPAALCPVVGYSCGAPVALQQCRTLHTNAMSVPHPPFNPSQRGHFYFGKKGTFLFWVDRISAPLHFSYSRITKGNE